MGKNVDIICIDFAKAFDAVPHKQLKYKLSLYSIIGNLLKKISDYLNMREMYVCFKENTLDRPIHNVGSSVPQGSMLAPLFFLLYIKDICNVVKYSKILMYADDFTLCRVVNNLHDASLLQYDLQAISERAISRGY